MYEDIVRLILFFDIYFDKQIQFIYKTRLLTSVRYIFFRTTLVEAKK